MSISIWKKVVTHTYHAGIGCTNIGRVSDIIFVSISIVWKIIYTWTYTRVNSNLNTILVYVTNILTKINWWSQKISFNHHNSNKNRKAKIFEDNICTSLNEFIISSFILKKTQVKILYEFLKEKYSTYWCASTNEYFWFPYYFKVSKLWAMLI